MVIKILLAAMLIFCDGVRSQPNCEVPPNRGPFIQFSANMASIYPAGALFVGYHYHNTILSLGYNSMLDNGQPALFRVRGGYMIQQRLYAYGGMVRAHGSNDNKTVNYTTYVIGAQWHMYRALRTTVYINAAYTPKYPTIGVGMSYNLIKYVDE